MIQIVVTQDLGLSSENIAQLKQLGEVKIYDELSKTPEEWLGRCRGADVICTGKYGLKTEKTYELKNVFFALPFVGVGFLDTKKLRERNITVSYCPGCNKNAVSERIIGMVINLLRDLPEMINNTSLPKGVIPKATLGLTNRNVTILGKGNIGTRVGNICEALGMNVRYFTRNDDLLESVKMADVIMNTLSSNPTSLHLLGKAFFTSLKRGSVFLSVTSSYIFDTDAMFEALDSGILASVAVDAGEVQVGDVYDAYYRKLLSHPKVFATPHIAYNAESTDTVANKMMIKNIEAWLAGEPVNVLK